MRKPGKNQIVRELRRRQKMAFDDDAGFAADLIEKQAARIADLESRAPAMAAEAVGIVHRPAPNGDHFSVEWLSPPAAGKLYAAPQPAQADARVGLTDEQILECATRRVPPREVPKIPELAFSRSQFVDVVRALLDDDRA